LSGNPSTDWYRTFFTELSNEFWRGAVPAEATEAEVDFVERHLGLKPGSRIVDVPCGSGRHTLTLASRGHLVTGVDISTEAIGYAERAAADAGLAVDLSVGEMRDIPRDGRFDAAICLGNSFGYFDLADTTAVLAALAGAVRPGGGLVIDYGAVAESVLPGFTGGEDTMEAGASRWSPRASTRWRRAGWSRRTSSAGRRAGPGQRAVLRLHQRAPHGAAHRGRLHRRRALRHARRSAVRGGGPAHDARRAPGRGLTRAELTRRWR